MFDFKVFFPDDQLPSRNAIKVWQKTNSVAHRVASQDKGSDVVYVQYQRKCRLPGNIGTYLNKDNPEIP